VRDRRAGERVFVLQHGDGDRHRGEGDGLRAGDGDGLGLVAVGVKAAKVFVPGRAWKVTWPLPSTAVCGPKLPVFPACEMVAVARPGRLGSLIWAVTAAVAKLTALGPSVAPLQVAV